MDKKRTTNQQDVEKAITGLLLRNECLLFRVTRVTSTQQPWSVPNTAPALHGLGSISSQDVAVQARDNHPSPTTSALVMAEQLPVIDLAAYYAADSSSSEAQRAVQDIHAAASTWGFFLLIGTAVSPQAQSSLLSTARAFFDLPLDIKMTLDVSSGGVAWRGYMPVGGEHTHGRVDWKEGLYIGPEHADDHPHAGLPLHGKNLFPDQALPGMRDVVLEYMEQVMQLGKTLTDVFSLGLGLGEDELRRRFIEPEPVVLFRCFKYAPIGEGAAEDLPKTPDGKEGFGIGEHTGSTNQLF